MKIAPLSWLVIPALAATLAGCPQKEAETTSTPPGGPPAGAVSAPPGPGAATPAGTAAPPGAATDAGHPTPPATGSTGNEILTRKVKNALIVNKVVTKNVGVSVNGGDITLSGSVPTMTQKTLAVKAARQVPGVTSVKDKLTAEGPQ